MTQMSRLPSAPGREDIDLGRILGLLLRHKWWILAVTLLFGAAGYVSALLKPPIYEGDALVHVERRASVSPLGDLATVMGEEENTSAEVQILRSRMVLGRVVDRLALDTQVSPRRLPLVGDYLVREGVTREDLAELGWMTAPLGWLERLMPEAWDLSHLVWAGESLQLARLEVADSYRGAAFRLVAGRDAAYQLFGPDGDLLGVGRVGDTARFAGGDVVLSVREMTAAPGAEFSLSKRPQVSAIDSLLSRLTVTEQGSGSSASTGMLRLTLTGTDIDRVRESLDVLAETFLMQNVERQSAQADQSLAFLDEQAVALKASLSSAEDRLNAYRVEVDSIDLDSEAASVVEQLISVEEQLNTLDFQEAELVQRFTRNHPTYQALMRQRGILNQEKARLEERVSEMPESQQEIVRLTRDVEVTQAIYVNVLNRAQEVAVAKAGTIGNVRVIDDAYVDDDPVAPNAGLMMALATVIGAFLAVAVVLVRGMLNRGIESPDQLEDLGLPVYATVPLSEFQQRLVKRVKYRSDRRSQPVIKGLLALTQPTDMAIEALRGLRTSLHFAMMEAPNNCLMITGPSPEIGKSFISLNLGVICAQAGQRVLVIDADMRKGHLHSAFGAKAESGLSDLLSDKSEVAEVIRHTEVEGLDYLSRGACPPNPSELLMRERFTALMEQFSRDYDLVIVDTPPVLAVTDAAIVGNRVGTSLLVTRFKLNPVKEVRVALRRLETSNVRVKGCILNAMDPSARHGYGYGHYVYAYQ
ncbi:polysaccharide biosynthesis tyrosine autokinase [Halomonas sp. H10-59]|uniref:Polysaccharide biosynthesis tyrosine autokinase n=1 Tax=Halomonas sp. H10-59 TaxID=2950874 RepID=A0AAU7KQC6_9GAMM